jgi:hypothetical protein
MQSANTYAPESDYNLDQETARFVAMQQVISTTKSNDERDQAEFYISKLSKTVKYLPVVKHALSSSSLTDLEKISLCIMVSA